MWGKPKISIDHNHFQFTSKSLLLNNRTIELYFWVSDNVEENGKTRTFHKNNDRNKNRIYCLVLKALLGCYAMSIGK
jgi:hypothetical protein